MKPKKGLQTPTVEDFIEEGHALEAVVRFSGDVHQADSEPACKEASECRQLALGIIAITHSYIGDLIENAPFDPKLAYCLACTVAFAQGATISNWLIVQRQYMKAAAVLKQDIELLARFWESLEDRAAKGKTPNISYVPEWARRAYGELNKIAHPSNFEEMHSVLSFPSGDFSIAPLRQHATESALYQVHVWNCIDISRAAIELLTLILDISPSNSEAKAVLKASVRTFGKLFQMAEKLSWNTD